MRKKSLWTTSLPLLAVSLFLAGCSSEGSTYSGKPMLTVRYYDDSSTPVEVGYSYVLSGEAAVFMDEKAIGGASYDRKSHNPNDPAVGSYRVFSGWSGFYDESHLQAVDLQAVTADCAVYARFSERALSYKTEFYQDYNGIDYFYRADGSTYGATYSYPNLYAFPSVAPADENAPWGHSYAFQGFYFKADSSATLIDPRYNLTFLSGALAEGALPSQTPIKGSLFLDYGKSDGARRNLLYGYNGTTWLSFGKMENAPTVFFRPSYEKKNVDFVVSFLNEKGGASLGTLAVTYQAPFTIGPTASDGTTTFTTATATTTIKLTFPDGKTSVTGWEGVYSSEASVDPVYRGNTAKNDAVYAPAMFYPLYA
jgi:hypothetical protein